MKLHILIKSCHRYADRLAACRETWLRDLPPDVSYTALLGGNAPPDTPENTYYTSTKDDYGFLPDKGRAGLEYALTLPDWDWIMSCDDDTYILPARLLDYILSRPPDVHAVGCREKPKMVYIQGGSGYILRREVVENVVRNHRSGAHKIRQYGLDEAQIFYAVKAAGYTWTISPLLKIHCQDNDEFIARHTHGAHDMRRIHTLLTNNK